MVFGIEVFEKDISSNSSKEISPPTSRHGWNFQRMSWWYWNLLEVEFYNFKKNWYLITNECYKSQMKKMYPIFVQYYKSQWENVSNGWSILQSIYEKRERRWKQTIFSMISVNNILSIVGYEDHSTTKI